MLTNESSVTINGHKLSQAQSMTLRVAVGAFIMSLQTEGLGDDPHGKIMTDAYLDRLAEICALMNPGGAVTHQRVADAIREGGLP